MKQASLNPKYKYRKNINKVKQKKKFLFLIYFNIKNQHKENSESNWNLHKGMNKSNMNTFFIKEIKKITLIIKYIKEKKRIIKNTIR